MVYEETFEKRDFVAIGVGVVLLVVSMTVTIRWGDFIIRLCEGIEKDEMAVWESAWPFLCYKNY